MKNANETSFQGGRLRIARLFHGLTLAELGEQVATSRQYIQRLEGKNVSPSESLLAALCEILHTEQTFFFKPLIGEIREEECHFRKLKTTPRHIHERALAYGTFFSMIVSYMEQELHLPQINIPELKVETREQIELAAEECRRRWNLRLDTPIDNMTRTLENSGGIVTIFDDVSDKVDAFSFYRDRPVVVRSSVKGSSSRARFDLAHELGHLVMHHNFEVGDPILEEQANQFASAFLLPRTAFLREFPRSVRINWNQLLEFKKRWGVSLPAIIRRAFDLRMLTAVQYRSAMIFIRRRWGINEPSDSEPTFEPMEILPTSFDLLRKTRGVSPSDIAAHLGVKCSYLEKFNIDCQLENNEAETDNWNNVVHIEQYRQSQSSTH